MGSLRSIKTPRTEPERTEDEIQRRMEDITTLVKDILQAFEVANFEDTYDKLKCYEQVVRILKNADEQPYKTGLYDELHHYVYGELYGPTDFFMYYEPETGIDTAVPDEFYIFDDRVYRIAVLILENKILTWNRLDVNDLRDMRHDLSKCLEQCLLYPHEPRSIDSIVPPHLIPRGFIPIGGDEFEKGEIIAADVEGRVLKRIVSEVVIANHD